MSNNMLNREARSLSGEVSRRRDEVVTLRNQRSDSTIIITRLEAKLWDTEAGLRELSLLAVSSKNIIEDDSESLHSRCRQFEEKGALLLATEAMCVCMSVHRAGGFLVKSGLLLSIKVNQGVSAYASSPALFNKWERCNSIVLCWSLNSVSEDLFLGQIVFDNAFEVSSKLKETYDKHDGSIIFNLLQKIQGFKQGELTASEYYHKLNSLWTEFDIMTKLPKCSFAAREDVSKHNQLIKLMQFLMGLNDMFQPVRSGLLFKEALPDVKDAFAIVSMEESHRGIASSSFGSVTKPQISSFMAKSNSWTNNGNKNFNSNKKFRTSVNPNNSRGPNPKLLCTNYGKMGHTIDKTFNANSATSYNEKGASLSFTNEHILKLMNLINDAPSGSVQENMAGFASKQNVGTGSENGGLYMFDSHTRLGHPSDQAVDMLHQDLKLPSSVLNGNDSCDKNVHNINFFDKKLSDDQTSICPNDDRRDINTLNDDGNIYPFTSNADESEGDFATSMGDTYSSEGHVPSSSGPLSQRSLPENTSQGSRKYGLEKYFTYANLNTSNYCFSTNLNKSSKPNSYAEAVKNPNWVEAMNNKIEALNRNNTWTICDLPSGRKTVGSKCQREGFDYLETFILVVKMSTVRCMLNVAICNNWDLFQLDINNAFSYGDLFEDVYMTVPPGFDNDKSKVCKLNKSLYGIKQALRQWNAKLTKALTEHGFVQSKFDYSLFTKKSDNVFIIMLVYVDDIVVNGNDLNEIEIFKDFLKSKFQIKDLGRLKYFLGIEVLDNKDGICLSQRKYFLEILYEFGLLAAKIIDTVTLSLFVFWNVLMWSFDYLTLSDSLELVPC
ncbi:ribonuclease H-like domain-containing protein [Tanacetum coccineum]